MNTTHWSQWQRAVIKVGSALIAPDGLNVSGRYTLPIAKFINEAKEQGKEVILVSSGAVAAGRSEIESHEQGLTIPEKQAMAAVGQSKMMANWQRFFDFSCAQLLITHEDLRDRKRYVNIKNTIRELLENHVLPIVNENDTVATSEIKVGDNDNLSALVALVCDADALFICSDIKGLYDADPSNNPDAKLIPEVAKVTPEIYALAGGTTNKIATGGMKTKLQAAEKATKNGIDTFIVNGKDPQVFANLEKSNQFSSFIDAGIGTWFKAVDSTNNAKQQWLTHTLNASGTLEIDQGAVNALIYNGASLLSKGIIAQSGEFIRGEAVDIMHQGKRIARGLVQYSSSELSIIAGKESSEFQQYLGFKHKNEIIHRDDLVIFSQR